ncbi:hypothetical protein HPP92_003585 [Vanilla planifolia]|uniref:Uncharacterized protein n=1 Tax=Vanilla planifolia TaxID=51239 RepID=A0A835VNM0_VANPL|nr:hypothetical protein HPP92_003585 [Vanilla planifolia]
MTITSIVQSLNPDDHSSSDVRVLNAALSLMCFKEPEVCSARIVRLVETVISVLDSLVSCQVVRLKREGPEYLQVGSSISFRDCRELINLSADVLGFLQKDSGLFHALLRAILRLVISSSDFRLPFAFPSVHGREIETKRTSTIDEISRITSFLTNEICTGTHETQLRLFLWYLNPSILKNDISEILRETMQRPFLCLKTEFNIRLSWQRIVMSLATSPTMFVQARMLLHNWFLMTGLTFVLEVQIAIVSVVLEMGSCPTRWGVSMDLGLKYPFFRAYVNNCDEQLAVLIRYVSCGNFLNVVRYIKIAISHAEVSLLPTMQCHYSVMLDLIDMNSTWALLLNFPTWFYFASLLLFYNKDNKYSYFSVVLSNEININSVNDKDLNDTAILYLSWVLSPIDKGHRDLLAGHFHNVVMSWSLVSSTTNNCEQPIGSLNKGSLDWSKMVEGHEKRDDKADLYAYKDSFPSLSFWLREYDSLLLDVRNASTDRNGAGNCSRTSNQLFIKVPLGMLILCPEMLSIEECELLLYYATTGEIFLAREMQTESSHYNRDARNWALNGTCLVFSLFSIIEEMSAVLFDCEETRLDYMCHLKGKVSKYLISCVKMLCHLSPAAR